MASSEEKEQTPAPRTRAARPDKSRLKLVTLSVAGVITVALAVAFVLYPSEIRSAFKLLFRLTPAHAKHIPRSALMVSRTNFAALALETGLQGAANDPLHKKMTEYGSKLYPRFDLLLENPVKETGMELADDVYGFLELLDEQTPAFGVLFGISDKKRFEEFVRRIRPGAPAKEGEVSLIRLDDGVGMYWNKSFALIYGGTQYERLKQRALAIMAMAPADSIKEDPVKKKWLEGKDDLLVSIDLEKMSKMQDQAIEQLLRRSLYKPESYIGSTAGFAFNFDKGRFALDVRADGSALMTELGRSLVPPDKEFLGPIPADSYQGFLAGHIQLAPLLEAMQQTDPESYRKANDFVALVTSSSIEQLVDSFTGDFCVVMEEFKLRSTEQSMGYDFLGNPLPPVRKTTADVEGTAAIGIKPKSAVARLAEKMLREVSSNKVKRQGKLYKIAGERDYYLLADNGYLALSTRDDAARSLADYKKGGKPAMPVELLDRASSGVATLDLKLSPLLHSVAGNDLPKETRSALESAAANLAELRVSSRLEKDQVVTQLELLFKDQSKNSLSQMAAMSLAAAETSMAQYRVKSCNAAALSDLKNAKTCLESYYADHQQYPASLAEADFKASEGVTVNCEHAPHGYACVSKHRDGNRLYATIYDDASIRSRECDQGENPPVPLGSVYEALDRL